MESFRLAKHHPNISEISSTHCQDFINKSPRRYQHFIDTLLTLPQHIVKTLPKHYWNPTTCYHNIVTSACKCARTCYFCLLLLLATFACACACYYAFACACTCAWYHGSIIKSPMPIWKLIPHSYLRLVVDNRKSYIFVDILSLTGR